MELTREQYEAAIRRAKAEALRDAAKDIRTRLDGVDEDRGATPWLVRANDIGTLFARAEELAPQ